MNTLKGRQKLMCFIILSDKNLQQQIIFSKSL